MMEGPIEMKYEMGGVMMGRGANMKEGFLYKDMYTKVAN